MNLEGRTAAVIGVGSSVGRATAVLFGSVGADVLAVDPALEVAASVQAEVNGAGGRAGAVEADLTTADGARAVADACDARWGRLDVLAFCGSAKDWWPLADDDVARWQEVIQANLVAPIAYTMALRPLLARSAAGSIVYLGSVDGTTANPNLPSYSVSKGGLVTLTHVMANLCGAEGTRVNCIACAAIDLSGTGAPPNLRGDTSDADERLRLTPLGRHATAADMANVALFFASDLSAYVNGAVLPVDGGRTAITPGTVMKPAQGPA